MKFDESRAEELVRSFDFPRSAGSEEEGSAARLVADEMNRIGLHVWEASANGRRWDWEIRFALSRLLGMGLVLPLGLFPPFAGTFLGPVAVILGALGFLGIVPILASRRIGFGQVFHSPIVMGRRKAAVDSSSRVVFVTSLDTPLRSFPSLFRWVSLGILGLSSLAIVLLELRYESLVPRLPSLALPAIVCVFELSLLFWIVSEMRPGLAKEGRDNRDGLATLLELARSWSPRNEDEIETWFVGTGGIAMDNAGPRELYRLIQEQWPGKPTLVLGFWSAGLGPPFARCANDVEGWEHATAAMESLRIPQSRGSNAFYALRELWPSKMAFPRVIALIGETDEDGEASIRPESMALCAQLASEIALRWVKAQTTPDPDVQTVDNASRSSQNRG